MFLTPVLNLPLRAVILLLVFRRIGGLKIGRDGDIEIVDGRTDLLVALLAWIPRLLAKVFVPLLLYAVAFFVVSFDQTFGLQH